MSIANTPTHEVDVLVLGAGMAGCMGGLSAADAGCSVLLVEPSNVLGGQGTGGGVAGFCGDTKMCNDIFAELVARLLRHDQIAAYEPTADRRPYELEWCAFHLQEMVCEREIEVLLHARGVDATAENGRVTNVRVSHAGGMLDVRAKQVIDATGRCIVPMWAGAEVISEGRNKHLPMSLYFTLWDSGKPVTPVLPAGCETYESIDELPMTTLHRFPSGKVEVKMKVVGFDAADGFSLSQAEMAARREMMGLIYFLQTHGYPKGQTLDTHVLAGVSRHIGIREERRIVGEHVLTEEEATHAAIFADAVAVGTYHLDYHWPDRKERAGTGITTMVEPYQIPLRSMIPEGLTNVLVPGRGASGDQMAMSSFRVMATVAEMGFAAGLAAAQAIKSDAALVDLDIPRLRANIEAGGQSLDLSDYGDYLRYKILVDEPIFESSPDFAQCHASTLVQLSNGRFLTAWFAGTAEKAPDVGIWASERRECRWSSPRCIAKINDEAHWNPVLFRAPNDELHLWFKVGVDPQHWRTYTQVSLDDGQTWSAARELVPRDIGGRGPVKNKPIVLVDGSWLAPGSIETPDGQWYATVDRSEDGGQTWGETRIPNGEIAGMGVIQPSLWESTPGTVHMLLRSTCGQVCRSDSTDGGKTWCPAYPTDLPNNNSGLDLAQLADGSLVLACNPVGENWGPRTPLRLLHSTDNGATWPKHLDLVTDEGEYSYPAIIPTAVGMAVTWTWQRRHIHFWHGSPERLQGL